MHRFPILYNVFWFFTFLGLIVTGGTLLFGVVAAGNIVGAVVVLPFAAIAFATSLFCAFAGAALEGIAAVMDLRDADAERTRRDGHR